jgi:hypothetical protein|tara:strand:+ start:108 stop:2078 length:1971 start_codon:yes stop_codon:yes gene_type:complete
MVNPYKFRKLFKPIKEATSDAYKAAVENPYIQNYADVVAGKKGRIAQGFGIGAPVYATNKIIDMAVPQRTTEPEKIIEDEVDITVEAGPENDNILIDENEIQIDAENTDTNTNVSAAGGSSSSDTTTSALVDQTNQFMGAYDNDSLARIDGYKDVIRQFMGDGDEGQRMQKMGMLVQLGSALMSGRSMDSGMKGFMDIVGQAGMQIAPTLFSMGVEKGKAEREIGAAALNMYMSQIEDTQDRSGPLTAAYENIYKRGENNELMYDKSGNPITIDKRKIGDYYRKSPEMSNLMDENNRFGFPKYTFIDPSATEAGLTATGTFGTNESATAEGKAARDAQMSYARFTGQGLDTMADVIMPILIQNKDVLAGITGEIGRLVAGPAAAVEQISNAIVNGIGGQAKLDEMYNSQVDSMIDKNWRQGEKYQGYAVLDSPNHFIEIDGKQVGFFIDAENKYGRNSGAEYVNGKQVEPGEATYYATEDGLTRLLQNPYQNQMITFENTLGLMLSRDRQPTGRMLADIMRRSFEDTKMTGLTGRSADPYKVISNYGFIFNELKAHREAALGFAGYTNDPLEGRAEGGTKIYAPNEYEIKGMDKFASLYYQLRHDPVNGNRYAAHNIGTMDYGAWVQSIGGNLQLDDAENNQTSEDITNDVMEQMK